MIRIIPCVLLLLGTTAFAAKDKKPEFVNDAAKRAAIKRVAILSVYGPEKMTVGVTHINEQPLYDALETELIRRLEGAGLSVVPPAETKALLAREFYDAYKANMKKDMLRHADRLRPGIEKGYMIQNQQSPIASKNTRVLFGTDLSYIELGTKKNTHEIGTDEKGYAQPHATYDAPLMKTLQTLAPKLGADGFVLLRAIPDMPPTVAKKASKWNPVGAITTGVSAMKSIKEGDHAFVTLDLLVCNNAGEIAFQQQVVRMSQETTGKGGGFNLSVGEDPANKLVGIAAARAMDKLFTDFAPR